MLGMSASIKNCLEGRPSFSNSLFKVVKEGAWLSFSMRERVVLLQTPSHRNS